MIGKTEEGELHMIEKLLHKYPDAVTGQRPADPSVPYIWLEEDRTKIGIPRSQLTPEELSLLETLFGSSRTVPEQNKTWIQQEWHAFLETADAPVPRSSWKQVRFLHFRVSELEISLEDFEEALRSLAAPDAVIVWFTPSSGTVIEGHPNDSLGKNELLPIIEALEGDFYSKIRVFAGSYEEAGPGLQSHFKSEQACFSMALRCLPDMRAASLADIYPFLLIEGHPKEDLEHIAKSLLGDILESDELLDTVKIYIECGSNASLAAKKLYMHRNGLQYRIDRFIEKTDLDIRTFQGSLAAYLILLQLKK